MGFFDKLKQGLKKTTRVLNTDIRDIFRSDGRLVDEEFSARHSARARRYRYQMLRRRSALWTRYHHVLRWQVDVDAMAQAAEHFLGEQDFTAFANVRAGGQCNCLVSRAVVPDGRRPIRLISSVSLRISRSRNFLTTSPGLAGTTGSKPGTSTS